MKKFYLLTKTLLVVVSLLVGGASSVWGEAYMTTMTGLLGLTDNSGDGWAYRSKLVTIAAGESYTYTLVNYNDGASEDQIYHNWIAEIRNTTTQYCFDVRPDGYCWTWDNSTGALSGSYSGNSSTDISGTTNVWAQAYNGVTATITVSRSNDGNTITVTHSATTNAVNEIASQAYGGTYTCSGIGTEGVSVFITNEKSHQDITKVVYTEADGTTTHTYGPAIEALPFSRTWTDATTKYPFNAGDVVSGTNVKAFRVYNTTAYAYFDSDASTNGNQPYALSENELVTFTFTAYHPNLGSGSPSSTVQLVNSANDVLVSYTYSQSSGNVTDVSFGGNKATGFADFVGRSSFNAGHEANGFASKSYVIQSNSDYNPVITMKVYKNGLVSFSYVQGGHNVQNKTYQATLDGVTMDIAAIKIIDATSNSDRSFGMNNLSITSEFLTAPTVSISATSSMIKKDKTVTLTANVSGEPTIQWYSNTVNSTEGAVAIPSATNTTYNPSTASNGTTYYYAVATNLIGSTVSDIVPVTVANYQDEFSAAGKSVAKTLAYNTADEELTSTNATISGGHMYVSNYKSGDDQTVVTSGAKFQMNGNAVFFKVVLNDALQAGDIISASVGNKTGYGISIYAEYSTTGKPSTANHADLSTTTNDFETTTYTIKNSDTYLIGKNTFYIYRLTANGTYFDNLKVSRPNVVSGKVGSTGWTTFSSNYKLDLNNVSGGDASAYYASSSNAGAVTLKNSTDIVGAGEGLLIKGTAGEVFTIAKSYSAETFSATNLLVGCPNGQALTNNANYYVMVNNGGTAEFQSLADNGATIPAGKAYLNTAANPGARLSIVFDDATAIKAIDAAAKSGVQADGKYLEKGKIIIVKNGVKFNANGQKVK